MTVKLFNKNKHILPSFLSFFVVVVVVIVCNEAMGI